ncbi:MAG: nitroreductase family protein [Bacteroidales bacterium]|nr:nitroreductase family protein [Bacteroidales bacterium]MDT8372618.1 nitroreductase family protein [Bacteroidales bacterium]
MTDGNGMLDLLKSRQSERKYLDTPVKRDKIVRITEAGRLSPSACNGQPWHLVVVDEPAVRDEVASATESELLRMNTFVRQAPVLIVVVREKSNITSRAGDLIKQKDYSVIDTGIVAASMIYQATAEGLGTCIIGWFDQKKIKKVLGIPASKKVELVISVGYTDNQMRAKSRKPPGDVITYNSF